MKRQVKRKIMSICLSIALVLSMVPSNVSMVQAASADTKGIIGNNAVVNKGEGEEVVYPVIDRVITEEDLSAAGTNWLSATKFTVYVHVTSATKQSSINAAGELGPRNASGTAIGKASSKYLIGSENTIGKSVDSSNLALQANGVGKAGTGNYKFAETNLTATDKNNVALTANEKKFVTITLKSWEAVEYELLGIVFNNGTKFPTNFTAPTNCEATTYDAPDATPTPAPLTVAKEKLKMSLDYADQMVESKYQAASWATFQTQLTSAHGVYDNSSSNETQLDTARASLEKVKSNLLFVNSTDTGNPLPFRQLSNSNVLSEMGAGINLGNTLDGHSGFTPSETAWQSVVTTKKIIKSMHDAGFNTVRIPVTWGNMIDEKDGYKINSNWMNRVQEIVDYCVSQDMYAIINIHHDGAEQSGWLRVAADDIDTVYEEFECVWRNIAEYFKDYDEHLIFESMNEITCMEGDDKNSANAIAYDTPIIVNLNQIFVNVVRSTGSNNSKRWLAAVAHYANAGNATGFAMPTDSYNTQNALMFAAHIYKSSTNTTWTYAQVYEVVNNLKTMASKFKVPMYLGEYGTRTYTQAGTESGYNDVARAYFSEIVHKACQQAGCVPVVWDQGCGTKGEKETGLFHYWARSTCDSLFKSITDAMMRGTYLPLSTKNKSWDFTDIKEGVTVTDITEITPSASEVSLNPGDVQTLTVSTAPSGTNDIVLWSTDDDSVATVFNGMIRAKGMGTTKIHVYSQSGSITKEISVKVNPNKSATAVTSITTDKDVYEITKGSSDTIKTSVLPNATADLLTYSTSNDKVASVNASGKIIATEVGTAFITITASSGITKVVKVKVVSQIKTDEIKLALHVLYNDASLKYYGTEIGNYVTVKGNGQYTVEFDLETGISSAGRKAGITALKNLTAVYIKDYDITSGVLTKSMTKKAYIKYDRVVVNGDTELTITDTSTVSAMNGSILDTGGPLNGWDGNKVKEVSTSSNTVNFTGLTVTKMAVTFTLSSVEWRADDVKVVTSETLTSTEKDIQIDQIGATKEITANVSPKETNALVSFVSSDRSVVDVNSTAMAPTTGKAKATLTAVGAGTATVTAYTDDGLTLEYNVTVAGATPPTETPVVTPPETEPPATEPPATEPPATEPPVTEPPTTVPPTGNPTATPVTTTPPTETQAPSVAKGDVVTVSASNYTVTDPSKKTVEYKAPTKKTITSVTIGDTVKVTSNGKTEAYKVTSIASNAFKGCKKLKTVTIGKNITKIGTNAFNACSAVKTIKIKGTGLKSIGKNAFKGINKKAVFTCPSKSLKAYKKLLKSTVGYKKTMKVKKG